VGGEGNSVTPGLGGVVYPLCPLGSRGVEFLGDLVGWPATSVAPFISFPSSLALPCFARRAAGQGSWNRVGFGVAISVGGIVVMRSDLGLFVGRFLGPSSPETVGICVGSSLVLIKTRRGDLNAGASRRSRLLVSYSPGLAARGEKFLSLYGFSFTQ